MATTSPLRTHHLTENGFQKLHVWSNQHEKISLYKISSLDAKVVDKALTVIKKLEAEKNLKFQGDLTNFSEEIKGKPYLVRRENLLELCSEEFSEKIPSIFGIDKGLEVLAPSSLLFSDVSEDKIIGATFTLSGIGIFLMKAVASGVLSWGAGKLMDELFGEDKSDLKTLLDQSVQELKTYFKSVVDGALLEERQKNLAASLEVMQQAVRNYNAMLEQHNSSMEIVEMRQAVHDRALEVIASARLMPNGLGLEAYFTGIGVYTHILKELDLSARITEELKSEVKYVLKKCYEIYNPLLMKMEVKAFARHEHKYERRRVGGGPGGGPGEREPVEFEEVLVSSKTYFRVCLLDQGKEVEDVKSYSGERDVVLSEGQIWDEGEAVIRNQVIEYENKRLREISNLMKIEETINLWEEAIKKEDLSYQRLLIEKGLVKFLRTESILFPLILFEAHHYYGPREGFEIGEYPNVGSTSIRDNRVSSFKLQNGYQAQLFNSANFKENEAHGIFTKPIAELYKEPIGHDKLSSFKVAKA